MLLKNDIDNIKKIVHSRNVLADSEELCCYSEDSNNFINNYNKPDLVVFVETPEQVQDILIYANQHKIPVVSRGAGTNMVGACTCPEGGIVICFSKMNKILDFNPIDMTMTVQPGVVVGDIKRLAESQGLFYPPDPSNYKVSTIGGSIAQSSGGACGFKYGTTKDYILSLKVVLADGTMMELGMGTIKEAVGYHLNQLIVGSEGTLAIVVEAKLKLIPLPETQRTIMAYFDVLSDATKAVNALLKQHLFPSAIDFMDQNSIRTVEQFYPSGLCVDKSCMLLINIDGYEISVQHQQELVLNILNDVGASNIRVALTKEDIENVWTARCSSFAATAKLAPDVLSDDIVVPRSAIEQMVTGCKKICDKYGLSVCVVGHLGDGNIHPQVALNLENEEEFKSFCMAKAEMYKLVYDLKGTISAEHGIGAEKMSYLEKIVSSEHILYMKKIKNIFDPNMILNPNKIFKI